MNVGSSPIFFLLFFLHTFLERCFVVKHLSHLVFNDLIFLLPTMKTLQSTSSTTKVHRNSSLLTKYYPKYLHSLPSTLRPRDSRRSSISSNPLSVTVLSFQTPPGNNRLDSSNPKRTFLTPRDTVISVLNRVH